MKSTPTRITLIFILLVLFFPNLIFAETITYIKEYTFRAGDEDNKYSSRVIAVREVKRLLLEELGTYLESETEVENFKLTKDKIITLTAGIVQTELVDEKWDGKTYWLKAKITADSGNVIKSIDALRKDRQKIRELEEMRKRADDLLKENERLRKELLTAKGEKRREDVIAYNKTIKDLNAIEWLEKGYTSFISGNYNEAIDAFSKTIELNSKNMEGYSGRGVAYEKLGNYNQAIKDYDIAIELNPKDDINYGARGRVYYQTGNYNQAIADYTKSIEINSQDANVYVCRGIAYENIGNYNQAIKDYDKAIELNHPNIADFYVIRGRAYGYTGNYNQKIKDIDKAIELKPKNSYAFSSRGLAYEALGNYNQAIKDYDKAIELNPENAIDYSSRGRTYYKLGNNKLGCRDAKKECELGSCELLEITKRAGLCR
jgi:tetratricopeptide (TPR) repeat protein